MNYFLAKSEPSVYSIDRLRQDKRTTWDGVTNPQAVRAIRAMNRGDRVFVYHSGAEPGVVGLAEVVSEARDDPKNPKSAVVDVAYLAHLEPPTPLAVIKSTSLFNDWALVRQGRLSTMQAPIEFVEWIRKRYPSVRI